MDFVMIFALTFSAVVVVAGFYFGNNPKAQEIIAKKLSGKKSGGPKERLYTNFDEDSLRDLKETAEEFLEFDTIDRGMISFTKDPNYFTMGFGVNGVNISMQSAQERMVLKNGFMSILNTLKEDTQFLIQSRYIDLSKNFEYYKPTIENTKNQRDILAEKAKYEKSEVVKKRMLDKIQKLEQRNAYANHIVDFFNFYTKDSECIYIRIFVIVGYRYNGGMKWQKKKIVDEAYNALTNKVKILRDQFEAIKLKTYELDNVQAANILYSTLAKNDSSFEKLEDAINNGLLDLAVQTIPGQAIDENKYDKYEDEYEYTHMDEAAVTEDSDDSEDN